MRGARGALAAIALITGLGLLLAGCKDEPTVRVPVVTDDGDGAKDAALVVARFEALDLPARAEDVGARSFTLILTAEGAAFSDLATVLAPGALEVRAAAADQAPVLPTDAEREAGVARDDPGFFHQGMHPAASWRSEDALRAALAARPPLPIGAIVGVSEEAVGDDPGAPKGSRWVPVLLAGPPAIGPGDISAARSEVGPNGEPVVVITMTDAGRARFADFTGAHVDENVAVVLDGVITSFPVVIERIEGGRASVLLSDPSVPMSRLLVRAKALAAALGTGPLTGRWRAAGAADAPK
ncbi:MAG: hypothetical protein KC635_14865 [Myxococcales bacterium]|nr:hypothetical protein [Myxococcales bacterium]